MSPLAAALTALAGAAGAVALGWLRPAAGGAALLVGVAHLAGAGWTGGLLLAVLVVSGSLLTRGARRRPRQVLANGGAAAVAALLVPTFPGIGWPILLGALATAQADTWATEIGRTSATPPRDIVTGRVVPHGTSGGVTWRGTAGGVAGAATMAAAALLAGLPAALALAGALAGTAGMLLDSVIGTLAQARYICEACGTTSEAARHCNQPGRRVAGAAGLDNDAVNAVATVLGGCLAWWLAS